jgi:hypothetical protein
MRARPGSRPSSLRAVASAIPDIAWVALLSLALTALWLWRTEIVTYDAPMFELPWDRHKYIAMAAGNPFDFHIAPYCWRIGKPLLAKLLPFGLQNSFLVISFASVWLAGLLSWLLAREARFSRALSLTGVLFFFALQWGPKFFLFEFWLPDATIFVLLLLAVLTLLRGNVAAFIVVTMLGVTVKESMLFVLPLAYTFRATQLIDLPAARRAALLGLPAIAMLVALRLAIPAWNDDPAYIETLPEKLWLVRNGTSEAGLIESFRIEMPSRLARFGPDALSSYTVGTFGPAMTLLPLCALRRNRRWFILFLPYLALIAAQMLFGNDTERYLILAFPAVLLMALNGLAVLSERFEVPEILWPLAPLTLIAFELALLSPYFLQLRFHALALVLSLLAIGATQRVASNQARRLRRARAG